MAVAYSIMGIGMSKPVAYSVLLGTAALGFASAYAANQFTPPSSSSHVALFGFVGGSIATSMASSGAMLVRRYRVTPAEQIIGVGGPSSRFYVRQAVAMGVIFAFGMMLGVGSLPMTSPKS